MKQPDLGKKIAELRKAKGLTQEELVATCNLNVRTLQRIEAGEVMPRSYTLRVIFSALEYPVYDVQEVKQNPFGTIRRMISLWFGQFYLYVLDLFNFKTNAMRKLTILSAALGLVALGLFAVCGETRAQSAEKVKKVIELSDKHIVQWINNGQVDSVMTMYLDDACLLPTYCGKNSIREVVSTVVADGYKILEYHTLSVSVENALAVEKYYCVFQYQGETVKQKGLTEWHKVKGKWLIANDITSIE